MKLKKAFTLPGNPPKLETTDYWTVWVAWLFLSAAGRKPSSVLVVTRPGCRLRRKPTGRFTLGPDRVEVRP